MAEYDSDNEQKKLREVLGRYKSSKGDADKRKVTSQVNMAKARAAKLAGLQASKRNVEIDSESESDDGLESDSDGEDLIIQKKKPQKGRGRGGAPPVVDDRMNRMEQMLMKLAMKNSKKKAPRKTVNIQIAPPITPALQHATNPHTAAIKHSICNWD